MFSNVVSRELSRALHADVSAACHEHGITQEELAALVRENPRTLSGYLCAHARVPADLICRVSRQFGVVQTLETMSRLADPEPEAQDISTVIPAVRKMARETAEAVDTVLRDVEDGRIDNLDADVRECNEAIDALRYLVRVLEGAVDAMPPQRIVTLAQAALARKLRTPSNG